MKKPSERIKELQRHDHSTKLLLNAILEYLDERFEETQKIIKQSQK